MDIIIATRNRKKIEEIRRILCNPPIPPLEKGSKGGFESVLSLRIFTLNDFPECPEVVEDEKTFEANAIKKAAAVARYTGMTAVADDSGLEVYALDGEPGILSSRYAGEGADDRENLEKLLYEMRSLDNDKRRARFLCCIAIATPDGSINTFFGYAEGKIGKVPKGISGFGYDPIFYPEGYTKTFAEMTDAEKDSISHRGKAVRKLYQYLTLQHHLRF